MDFVETGEIIGLPDGWYLDTKTKTRFQVKEDGSVVAEDGTVLREADEDEADE